MCSWEGFLDLRMRNLVFYLLSGQGLGFPPSCYFGVSEVQLLSLGTSVSCINLNQPVWNFLISTNVVTSHICPLHP